MTLLWRTLIAACLIVLIGAGAAWVFQPQISEWAFRRAVAENIGRDRSADLPDGLPDGLHVFVCGAGSPLPDPHRAGPCLGILAGERAFIVDTGSGGIRNLARMGFPLDRIEGIYLTHLHSDHIDGLGETLMQAWVGGGRTAPLPVSGPVGTGEVVAGFNAAYRLDAGYRAAHHGTDIADPAGFGGAPVEIRLPSGPAAPQILLEEDGLSIAVFAVNHAPVEPAFGYRIDYKGRSVVISGDTVLHPGLIAAARGVDVLFHEALEPDMVRAMSDAAAAGGNARIAKILNDILDYHASPADAARAANEAGARDLVLIHIVPPLPSHILDRRFVGDAKKVFHGRLTLARDGLVVSLPAATQSVDYKSRF